MSTFSKILLLAISFNSIMLLSYADRGVSKKTKNKVTLNITPSKSFTTDLSFNLKSGLKYKGSLLSGTEKMSGNSFVQNTIVTYQKGNTIYVIPYKQKIIVPEIRQGYTGMKLIIKSN